MDKATWKVTFLNEKCIACGMCIDACPPGAMKAEGAGLSGAFRRS